VLFAATDGRSGHELWRTSGTRASTWLVRDIAPGPASSNPSDFVVVGEQTFFVADDGMHGRELWVMQ
jgi:ELWxxDGT repeat protein